MMMRMPPGSLAKAQLDLVLFRQPAMIVEVGDQFLDDDAKPRQFVLGQPLRLAKCPRRVRRLD